MKLIDAHTYVQVQFKCVYQIEDKMNALEAIIGFDGAALPFSHPSYT